jgi:hypothetical protein
MLQDNSESSVSPFPEWYIHFNKAYLESQESVVLSATHLRNIIISPPLPLPFPNPGSVIYFYRKRIIMTINSENLPVMPPISLDDTS